MLKAAFKRLTLCLFACLGYLLGLPLWNRLGNNSRNSARIIRYHSISNSRRHEVNIKVASFQRQMEYLKRRFNPVSLGFLTDSILGSKGLPDRAVVVTFDDGYMDNFQNAYPILRRHDTAGTVFLTSDYIGTDRILPHDRGDDPNANRLLDWDQIKEMHGAGLEFGSHGATHANLAKIQRKKAEDEIESSKARIEEELHHKIDFFSYPYGTDGDFNNDLKKIVRNSGYRCACSAMYGVNYPDTDIYELRRIGIESSDTMFTFKAKLNGALDILELFETGLGRKVVKIFNKLLTREG